MNLRRSFLLRSLLRRFLFFLFALALSPSPPLVAQSSPGAKTFTLNAANQNACIGTASLPTVAIIVTGTFSATLQPQTSINGSTPQNAQVTPTTSNASQSTITTAGNYVAAVGGFDTFCLNVSAYTSGSATVVLNPSPALNAGLIGSAAGGATPGVQAGIYAVSGFGLHNDGRFIPDVTTSSGHNTISCPNNDCNFTTADNGKICFATNMSSGGGGPFTSSLVILPQGTLTVTGAQTGTCSGGNATQTVTAAGVLVWGHDDTTPLQNAFAATLGTCSTLFLPGVNSQGTGPAVMLVQSAEFGVTGATGTYANCGTGNGSNGRGVTIAGSSSTSSYIIPTPNFSAASCTFGHSGTACFFGLPDGIRLRDFTIYGAGNSEPGAAFNGLTGADIIGNNWVSVRNMQFLGWGANNTSGKGLGTGIQINALYAVMDHVDEDGFGATGVLASNAAELIANQFFDNGADVLNVDGGAALPIVSVGGTYGDAGNAHCVIKVSGGIFNSFGDIVGYAVTEVGAGYQVCVEGSGVANLYGDYIDTTQPSTVGVYVPASGGIARLRDTVINQGQSGDTAIQNTGTIFDLGGNTISGTTNYSGAGNYIALGHQLTGACTGTASSSSTLGLYGTGPNQTTTACTSTTIGSGVVMTAPGTLATLIVTASNAGASASSGVVTVLKNGSTTTITCTIGTGTACQDGTHTVSYVAGDLISLEFTTQGTETLAGVKASVVF
jgi:hypothetical protein